MDSFKTMNKPHQRKGADSNTQVGKDFEAKVKAFLESTLGLSLTGNFSLQIGIAGQKKGHNFDLGNEADKIIVECKAHKWTEGNNVPSAKMRAWNEAMFFFHAAPEGYRKMLFVIKDFSEKHGETLGNYYLRTNPHLIPNGVEVWEYDEIQGTAARIN